MLRWILRLYFIILLQTCLTCAKNSSLTFVIDDTRSMWDDIDQVRQAAGEIMNIVTREKASEISEVVLVTFNDPEVVLRKKTSNKNEFIDALNNIVVHSGYRNDCPEYALSGIERALRESMPGSYLYVFTDATAKDYKRLHIIKSLCEKKQSQVVLIVTNDCHRPFSKRYTVYHDIAKACSGQVFRVSKNDVKDVLNTIKETARGQKSVVTSKVVPANFNTYTPVQFTVDDKTEYVIISASGQNVNLCVTDRSTSGGNSMNSEKIMWKPSGKVVKFDAPSPGTYYAWVKGETDISIVVYARTDFKFDHGFSEFVPKSLADASKLPIADRKHYLSISVTDPDHTVEIKSAEILDMSERVIAQLPLKKANGDFYITNTFTSPSTMFKIQVTGRVKKTGKGIRRISKTAIEPQVPPPPNPRVPIVTITEGSKLSVDYNSEISLTCKVSGYPAPDITWTLSDDTVLSRVSNVVELPFDHISYLKLPNVKHRRSYYCRAHNALATRFATVDVDIRSPFTVKMPPTTTAAKYENALKLLCDISSSYPMDFKWNTPLKASDYSLSADNKVLTIKSVDFAAQGSYICQATLLSDPTQKHAIETNVVISDLGPPAISSATPSKITVSFGEKIKIWCKIAGGVPRPSISWQVLKNGDNVYRNLSATGEELIVDSARLEDAGHYRCIATNFKGEADRITKVIVQRAPLVVIEEGAKKLVTYDSSNVLTCKIVAYPLPKIAWIDSKGNKLYSQDIIINNEITSRLKLNNVKVPDTYFCFAENIEGKSVSNIDISVTSPFIVPNHPKGTMSTSSLYGLTTDINCDVKSPFPLKIRWFFRSNALALSEIHSSDKYTISPTGTTLHILFTDLDVVGKYTCEASLLNDVNQKVDFTTDVQIDDLSPPVLQNTEPKIVTVQTKDKVKIPCKILGGLPPPVISWKVMRKDDTAFRDLFASGQELTLDSAALVDSGQYQCTAKNAQGQTSKTTELIVQQTPEVSIDEGAGVTVPYGSTAEFNCQIVAFPLPKTVSFRDSKGNELIVKNTINNHHKVSSRLRIQNIKSSDKYSCYAENNLGKSVNSIQVTVLPAIHFGTKHPETTRVKYADPTNIICDAKSSFPMKIKWFYQNKLSKMTEIHTSNKYMVSPDERTLHIISTDLDLVGKYTCEASLVTDQNDKKSFTTEVEISNLKFPEITESDSTIVVMNGQRMSAFCKADGIPKPDIIWEYKSTDSNVFTTIPAKGERITNPKIDYEGAGSYKCIATSKVGTQSHIIDVVVHGKPKITNVDTEFIGVTGDKVLKIPCNVTGVPEPTITWKHDDKELTSDAKIYIVKNALFIKNPVEKDSSNFTCEARNKYGNATQQVEAIVSDFIDYDKDLNNKIYLKLGESKEIECLLPHSDPQSVRWYVNGVKTDVLGTFYSLKNVNPSNDGNYTCRLNTDQGSKSQNYVVDVGFSPSFEIPPSPTITWNGDKEDTLGCYVRAKPSEEIEWFYNGKQLDGKMAEHAISGWGAYTCKVSNVHGSVQHTFNVTSDGCLINRAVERVQNTPLLIGDEPSTWPKFSTQFEFLTISRNEMITLECSTRDQPTNTLKTHPKANRINAECYNEDKFIVGGKIYKFEDLQCKEYVRPSHVFTKKPCMQSGEIIEVGFKLNNGFLGVYEVCYSEADHRTLYTKVLMSDVNMGNLVGPAFKLNPGIKTDNPSGELMKCQYNKRWLVSPVDVTFGPAQIATLSDKYNAVPVYEPCAGSSRLSWSGIENTVESALYTMFTLTAWTGASHYNSNGIPRYLWKVVKFDDDTFETIVYVNAPSPDSSDVLCPKTSLDKFTDLTDANDRYTYSCSMEDFTKHFKIPLSEFGLVF